jgi:hypothetical protein
MRRKGLSSPAGGAGKTRRLVSASSAAKCLARTSSASTNSLSPSRTTSLALVYWLAFTLVGDALFEFGR